MLDFDELSVPPSRLNRQYGDQISVFPSLLGSYHGVRKSVPKVTIELFNAMRALLDARIRQIWRGMLRWTSQHVASNTVGFAGQSAGAPVS